jgi:hypothetical protein
MSRYSGMKQRFPSMPRMVFGERASRFISLKLAMLLAVPVMILNRYAMPGVQIRTSIHHAVHAPAFAEAIGPVFSSTVHQVFRMERVSRNRPVAPAAAVLGPGRAMMSSRIFNSPVHDRPGMIGYHSSAAMHAWYGTFMTLYAADPGRMGSSGSPSGQVGRPAQGTFIDRIRGRHGIRVDLPVRRHVPPAIDVLPKKAAAHVTSRLGGEVLAGYAHELVFRKGVKTGNEIMEMKRILKETEDRVREKVSRQLGEMVTERNRQVDIGQLTHQVSRNIERMIRSERERRGM